MPDPIGWRSIQAILSWFSFRSKFLFTVLGLQFCMSLFVYSRIVQLQKAVSLRPKTSHNMKFTKPSSHLWPRKQRHFPLNGVFNCNSRGGYQRQTPFLCPGHCDGVGLAWWNSYVCVWSVVGILCIFGNFNILGVRCIFCYFLPFLAFLLTAGILGGISSKNDTKCIRNVGKIRPRTFQNEVLGPLTSSPESSKSPFSKDI